MTLHSNSASIHEPSRDICVLPTSSTASLADRIPDRSVSSWRSPFITSGILATFLLVTATGLGCAAKHPPASTPPLPSIAAQPRATIPSPSVLDCSTMTACANQQPRLPRNQCNCRPMPLCNQRCLLGATTDDKDSCWNHPDYQTQTINGLPCAWTYAPSLPPGLTPHDAAPPE